MYNNMKAFEYAKEITVACAGKSEASLYRESGQQVANFFEAVFNKLVELEKID